MKLTHKKAMELRKRGIKVDPRQIVYDEPIAMPAPIEEKPPKVEVKKPAPEKVTPPIAAPAPAKIEMPPSPDVAMVILGDLVQVVSASERNIAAIAQVQAEMAKPKPKIKMRCTIGRNSRGDMSTVDIVEY
jgi:hypothetical protein